MTGVRWLVEIVGACAVAQMIILARSVGARGGGEGPGVGYRAGYFVARMWRGGVKSGGSARVKALADLKGPGWEGDLDKMHDGQGP